MKSLFFISAAIAAAILLLSPPASYCGTWDDISAMLGSHDAAVVTSPENEVLFAKNSDKLLVPASTLKILTALTAFYHLGVNFRFKTEFYIDTENNLVIKGYGDPLLVSEEVEKIAEILAGKINKISGIVLDDSYFAADIETPGTKAVSHKSYDAPIGALCVNFNTVNIKKAGNGYVSAEPQTPLLPSVLKRLKGKNIADERILLSGKNNENLIYAGELFAYFLRARGVMISGPIRPGPAMAEKSRLIYRHYSCFDLTEVVAQLMEYSNNFVANQLLAATGAKAYGRPATIEKGVQAAADYAKRKLGISPKLAEGSGISRQNKISAQMFIPMLNAFARYYSLMPEEKGIYFKTGTLDGISTRAGYIEKNNDLFRFAVLINTSGKDAAPVAEKIAAAIR
ncbi:MAG: D-alanyl-D-alanine carboxypeptidase/D-alanyl-D-alanine-endopeptidase [Desulfobacterales bacterium]